VGTYLLQRLSFEKRRLNMLRKALITIAAAATMAVGMTSLAKPASADVFLGFGFGDPYYGYNDPFYYGYHRGFRHHHYYDDYYGGYHPRCYWRTVKVWRHHHWEWRKVRVCRGYQHYGY
jgi:hypothetical protein